MENANLSTTTLKWLYDAARWARFISILGFIFIGFMIIIGIVIGPVLSILNEDMNTVSGFSALSNGTLSAIYISLAAIYFFPVYYLFLFSNNVIKSYKAENEESLNASFIYLKKHFKFIGVLAIITLAIYTLLFIIGIAAAVMNLV
jgi:hypothetical protein